MKVYGIHIGDKWEGGGVSDIYAEKETAIKFALMLVEQKNKKATEVHGENSDFRWKENLEMVGGSVVKCWENFVDIIIIYEYEVK